MTNLVEAVEVEFNKTMVSGSTKATMKQAGASSRDLWQVQVKDIRVIPGFNVRVKDEAYDQHIRNLANSIMENGYFQEKALGGYIAMEGDTSVIYIHDGHCRLAAVELAISEGAQIERLPVVVAPAGTSLEDLTVGLVQSNTGKPLSPFEVAVVCKRLTGYGWDAEKIAARLGITNIYVDSLLQIMGSPLEIREMIQSGKLSVNTALDAMRRYGSDVVAKLQEAEANANAGGKTRVTGQHLPGKRFESFVKRSGPKLYEAAQSVKNDPGFNSLSADTKALLESLLGELAGAKEKAGA